MALTSPSSAGPTSASRRCSIGWSGQRLALVDDTPGVTRDRREGEAALGDLRFRVIDTAGLEDVGDRQPRQRACRSRPSAALERGRRGAVRDRRARRRHAARPPFRRVAAPRQDAGGAGGQQGGGTGRRPAALLEAFALGLGEPVRDLGRARRGHGRTLRRARRPSPTPARGGTRRRAEDGARAAAAARHRRPAQCRQVDPGQPPDRRGAAADRARGRHHPRRDRHALAHGAAGRCGSSTPPGCGGGPRSRASSKSSPSPTRCAPSASPRWWCWWWTRRRASKSRISRIAELVEARAARWCSPLNKWDAGRGQAGGAARLRRGPARDLAAAARGAAPVVTLSALSGTGVDKLMPAVFETHDAWDRRIATPRLNRWLARVQERHPPPLVSGRRAQAALHGAGQYPPADLRALRLEAGELPDSLSALSGQSPARGVSTCRASPSA